MERNKVTLVILVSAFILFCLVLSLSPSKSANIHSINSTTPLESVQKCSSPPGKQFTKAFAWEIDCWNAYPDTYYEPLVDAWIYVEYLSYECGTAHWIPVGWYLTSCLGEINLCGPIGQYSFTWVKDTGTTETTCMQWSDQDRITCCKDYYCDYLMPKGGDKAFLFSLSLNGSPYPTTYPLGRFPVD